MKVASITDAAITHGFAAGFQTASSGTEFLDMLLGLLMDIMGKVLLLAY
jgi:hypothetical protein